MHGRSLRSSLVVARPGVHETAEECRELLRLRRRESAESGGHGIATAPVCLVQDRPAGIGQLDDAAPAILRVDRTTNVPAFRRLRDESAGTRLVHADRRRERTDAHARARTAAGTLASTVDGFEHAESSGLAERAIVRGATAGAALVVAAVAARAVASAVVVTVMPVRVAFGSVVLRLVVAAVMRVSPRAAAPPIESAGKSAAEVGPAREARTSRETWAASTMQSSSRLVASDPHERLLDQADGIGAPIGALSRWCRGVCGLVC